MTCLVCGFRFKARLLRSAVPAMLRWQNDGIPLLTVSYACDECREPLQWQVWGFALMGREAAA